MVTPPQAAAGSCRQAPRANVAAWARRRLRSMSAFPCLKAVGGLGELPATQDQFVDPTGAINEIQRHGAASEVCSQQVGLHAVDARVTGVDRRKCRTVAVVADAARQVRGQAHIDPAVSGNCHLRHGRVDRPARPCGVGRGERQHEGCNEGEAGAHGTEQVGQRCHGDWGVFRVEEMGRDCCSCPGGDDFAGGDSRRCDGVNVRGIRTRVETDAIGDRKRASPKINGSTSTAGSVDHLQPEQVARRVGVELQRPAGQLGCQQIRVQVLVAGWGQVRAVGAQRHRTAHVARPRGGDENLVVVRVVIDDQPRHLASRAQLLSGLRIDRRAQGANEEYQDRRSGGRSTSVANKERPQEGGGRSGEQAHEVADGESKANAHGIEPVGKRGHGDWCL